MIFYGIDNAYILDAIKRYPAVLSGVGIPDHNAPGVRNEMIRLKTLGVRGTAQELETLVEDVKGHALTLQIMGGFLKRAFGGDIRQRDRVKFEKADEKIDGGHAFRAMAAYAQWMEDGSDEARRELAILRCLGLFDRPVTRDCLGALLQPPAITGLTEPLVGVAQEDWQFSLDALDRANLLALNRDPSGALLSLDTHPHIREYFAKQLREQYPNAWRAAHRRLYEHLCAKTKEGDQPTLEDLHLGKPASGIPQEQLVSAVSVQWLVSEALELKHKKPTSLQESDQ